MGVKGCSCSEDPRGSERAKATNNKSIPTGVDGAALNNNYRCSISCSEMRVCKCNIMPSLLCISNVWSARARVSFIEVGQAIQYTPLPPSYVHTYIHTCMQRVTNFFFFSSTLFGGTMYYRPSTLTLKIGTHYSRFLLFYFFSNS